MVLRLDPGLPMAVDRALFLPAVHGPAIEGTAHDGRGFVPVDQHARVPGVPGVYAAGDVTALALKHSTLASAQGTAAAEAIAAAAGGDVEPEPWSRTLFGILTLPPHFPAAPRFALAPRCRARQPLPLVAARARGGPPPRALPRICGPWGQTRPRLAPHGIPIAVPMGEYAGAAATASTAPTEESIRQDAITRRLMAVRRAEREGEKLEPRSSAAARSSIVTSAPWSCNCVRRATCARLEHPRAGAGRSRA